VTHLGEEVPAILDVNKDDLDAFRDLGGNRSKTSLTAPAAFPVVPAINAPVVA
jgi:hypothetical protein